jgi:hypothetical protein
LALITNVNSAFVSVVVSDCAWLIVSLSEAIVRNTNVGFSFSTQEEHFAFVTPLADLNATVQRGSRRDAADFKCCVLHFRAIAAAVFAQCTCQVRLIVQIPVCKRHACVEIVDVKRVAV